MAIVEIDEDSDAGSGRELALSDALNSLTRAAELLFVNGQTTERTVKAVEGLAQSLGLVAAAFLQWDDLRIHVSDGGASRLASLAAAPTAVHMGKVVATMRAMSEARREGSAASLRSRLEAIEKTPPVSALRFAVMAAAGAAALAVIFGAGDLLTLTLVALSGGSGACLRRAFAKTSANPFVQPFAAALLAGLIGAVVADLHLGAAMRLVVFCPCMVLVPGPHLLNGTLDLIRARIALGTARVVYASMVVLSICAGLLIGLAFGGARLAVSGASSPVPLIYDIPAAGVAVAAYGAFFSMPWRFLPIPVAVGMLAHAARWLVISMEGGSAEMGALIACAIVGTAMTPIAHRLRLPFAALAFASVVSLIPGVFLFQMADGLVDLAALGAKAPGDLLATIAANGAAAFMIMLAITLGVILPKMVIEWRFPMDDG